MTKEEPIEQLPTGQTQFRQGQFDTFLKPPLGRQEALEFEVRGSNSAKRPSGK